MRYHGELTWLDPLEPSFFVRSHLPIPGIPAETTCLAPRLGTLVSDTRFFSPPTNIHTVVCSLELPVEPYPHREWYLNFFSGILYAIYGVVAINLFPSAQTRRSF